MSLRLRFHLLTLFFFVISAVPVWLSVRTLAEGIVEQWAVRYAEKQVLYDKERTLQPILREVALARQLANSQYIREWSRQPDDDEATRHAVAEMESYRQNFQDHNYFVALKGNGRYYFNNAQNEFAGREYRYTLNPKQPKDAWFYELIRQGRDIHINVNPDPELGITKLWIDVLIRDGSEIVGIAGTGLDLGSFIGNVVEEKVPGVTSLFIDRAGAIQLHRNQALIDFGSVSKRSGERNTIDLLFEDSADRKAIYAAMKLLEVQNGKVVTELVNMGGKRHLAGLVYLPEIDWYEITLLDLDVLLPFGQFSGIILLYAVSLLGILVLFNMTLSRLVLRPLSKLDAAMALVETGGQVPDSLDRQASGEIASLMRRFMHMARAVSEARHDLEGKVQERTQALDRLSKTDSLTELLNRRGMSERLEAELVRMAREERPVGILWLDVDHFKQINDQYGHATGDLALKAIAGIIEAELRRYDVVSRWGGDEFLVMLQPAGADVLAALGERIRSGVASCRTVLDPAGAVVLLSVSIGGALARPGEDLDSLLHRGDTALYAAKAAGRNVVRLAAPADELTPA